MRTRACHGSDNRTFLQNVDDALGCGLRPTLAIVFCSPTLDFSELSEQLDGCGMAVVGASTAGEIINGSVREDGCVALLLEAAPAAFAIQLYDSNDGSLIFAGTARRLALGPLAEDEAQGISELWPAPMAGFFAYGEIGSAEGGDCDFHTESCTLVAIREGRV